MQRPSPYQLLSMAVMTCVLLLSGCGGGSSSGASSTTGTTTVSSTPTTTLSMSTIVTSVAAATYGAGSEQRYAYDYLNAQRFACGFGLLQQDRRIDQAAQAHADYLVTNNLINTHFENLSQFPSGFTGVYPFDRMTVAGYVNATATVEVLTGTVLTYAPSRGQDGVMELFSVPYHGIGQLSSLRDVGIGFNTRNDIVIDLGATTTRSNQLLGVTDVRTYPCADTVGILSQSYANESPVPIPGRNLQTAPIGTPIFIKVRDGQALTISSVDLRMQGTTTPVALLSISNANDTNNIFRDQSAIVFMPSVPLQTNTTYAFTATGANSGHPVNIAFTFTTGAH